MIRRAFIVAFVYCMIAGCVTPSKNNRDTPVAQRNPVTIDSGSMIARAALDVVGTPYRYGGEDQNGFDCSGLVQWAHARAGISIPRTTAKQFQAVATRPRGLQIGDVLFFRIKGRVSHNGIYLGDGRFVHAPSTGKNVSIARTDSPYFRKRLAGVRRFH